MFVWEFSDAENATNMIFVSSLAHGVCLAPLGVAPRDQLL